jgi:hypothetical protein
MKNSIVLIFLLIFTFSIQRKLGAQSDTSSFKGKSSFLFELGGPELLGGYFNYFLNNRISANVGLGIDLDCHLGTNLYLIRRNKSRHSIYLGGQIAYYRKLTWLTIGFGGPIEPDDQFGFYLPLGYEYVAKSNFTLQVDLGPNFVSKDWGQSNTYPLLFSIKIGKILGSH